MKTSHIFWGVFFIALGGFILLNNFTSIYFDWETLAKLWPAVLILWGLSLFIKDNRFVKGFIISLLAIIIALTIFSSFNFIFDVVHYDNGRSFTGIVIEHDSDADTTNYFEPFNLNIKESKFQFQSGAGHFEIKGTSEGLFSATTAGVKNNYTVDMDNTGDNANINFSMKKGHFPFGHGKLINDVEMKLNPSPVWDLNFSVGAAGINLDLSPYIIEKLDIEMGAAKLKVKFGDKSDNTKLYLEAGISKIEILVPESSGCEINSETVLSNKHFNGFNKISSGLFRTANFDSASKKIYLSFNTGVSSIKVNRYSDWQ
jgi:LiaI-LiaF-like transmembrane region